MRIRTFAGAGVVALLVMLTSASSPAARTHPAADPAVVSSWNAITVRTVIDEGKRPPPEATLYFGIVSAAVHDAVVAIEGDGSPYAARQGARRASSQAAAATAAHRVLTTFFPASAAALAADREASLAAVPERPAKDSGVAIGEEAAAQIVRIREGDGRNADHPFTASPEPGVWRPTPPAFAPFTVSWLGFVRPLLLDSPTQIAAYAPHPLEGARYAREFAEVKALGSIDSTARTPAQTDVALFWSGNPNRGTRPHSATWPRGTASTSPKARGCSRCSTCRPRTRRSHAGAGSSSLACGIR